MNRLIVICECPNAKQFSEDAHHLLFKDEPLPQIVVGTEAINLYAANLPRLVRKRVRALARDLEQFGYEVLFEGESITEIWDLFEGARIV